MGINQELLANALSEHDRVDTLLQNYSEEMGVSIFSVDLLIDSHRFLKIENDRTIAERHEVLRVWKEMGRQQGYMEVTDKEYVKVSDLKAMTVSELVEFLRED